MTMVAKSSTLKLPFPHSHSAIPWIINHSADCPHLHRCSRSQRWPRACPMTLLVSRVEPPLSNSTHGQLSKSIDRFHLHAVSAISVVVNAAKQEVPVFWSLQFASPALCVVLSDSSINSTRSAGLHFSRARFEFVPQHGAPWSGTRGILGYASTVALTVSLLGPGSPHRLSNLSM